MIISAAGHASAWSQDLLFLVSLLHLTEFWVTHCHCRAKCLTALCWNLGQGRASSSRHPVREEANRRQYNKTPHIHTAKHHGEKKKRQLPHRIGVGVGTCLDARHYSTGRTIGVQDQDDIVDSKGRRGGSMSTLFSGLGAAGAGATKRTASELIHWTSPVFSTLILYLA